MLFFESDTKDISTLIIESAIILKNNFLHSKAHSYHSAPRGLRSVKVSRAGRNK